MTLTNHPDAGKTSYVVLRASEVDTVGNVKMDWRVVDSDVAADNATAAVRAVASSSGDYVAIPKRSFQPVQVEVETTPRVKIFR